MDQWWLGLDLGTTGIRCIAFDRELRAGASAYVEQPPDCLPGGLVEQDPRQWVTTALGVIADVAGRLDPGSVRGLAISSQSITIVPVDDAGQALRPAISWLDSRGEEQLSRLAAVCEPATVVERTGKPWEGTYVLPKLAWLDEHEPETMRDARWFWTPQEYVLFHLTGVVATDHTLASGTMLYRNDLRAWDPELIALADVRREQWAPIRAAGALVGPLRDTIADAVGLPSVPVCVGAQDQKCAALAAGLAPGVLTLSLGTAAALEAMRSTPASLPGVPTFSYFGDREWVAEGVVHTAAAANRWFAQNAAPTDDVEELGRLAAATYPASDRPLFFPHLARVGQPAARARWGVEPAGVFWGLTLDATPGDMARAVLEGVAYEVALLAGRLAAPEARVLRVFGGGAQSDLWCRMLADITGLAVEVLASHEAAAAGAAMLAGAPGPLRVERRYCADAAQRPVAERRLDAYAAIRNRLYD